MCAAHPHASCLDAPPSNANTAYRRTAPLRPPAGASTEVMHKRLTPHAVCRRDVVRVDARDKTSLQPLGTVRVLPLLLYAPCVPLMPGRPCLSCREWITDSTPPARQDGNALQRDLPATSSPAIVERDATRLARAACRRSLHPEHSREIPPMDSLRSARVPPRKTLRQNARPTTTS